ncbi:MAG: Ig domain-containing protein, partial [Clostridia bacterium]|nr:Ig domain-containing protein [Clostridia bacterium]
GSGYISYDVFHPTSAGTVEVMVRSNYNPRIKATKTITIDGTHHALMGISPVNANVSVEQGGTAQLEVTYNPANASNKTLTWTSVYPEIATVDANGVVTGVSAGTGMIIACSEDGGRACIFAVNVTAPAASIVINNGAASASVTDLGTTNLTVVLSNTTYQAVTWSSSDTTVATVSGNASSATVTALKPGTVTITAEYSYDSAIKDTISVTVNKANVSVSISGNSTVEEESNITLTASVTPAVYDRSVTWSSSNTSVATVSSSGVVTGVGEGTATITATSKYDTTKTATKTITVTAKSQGGGTTIYAPAFSASQSTYPAGAVVYNPADGKYYSYFNANLIAWTNTGAIDSAWTQVTTDLSNVPTDSTNYGSHYCTEVVYNGTDYLLPTTAYGTGYAVSNGWMNLTSFWNPVPAAYSQYFNVGTTY